MQNRVRLEIMDGPLKGKKFEFAEHDTFISGRAPDCHAHLPDDTYVSRHHFILEVNPPLARLRDLGSLNATYVNNRKCGGRKKSETPEEGAKRKYPAVDLNHGDRIRVGDTIMAVTIEGAKVQPDESAQVREELARLIFASLMPERPRSNLSSSGSVIIINANPLCFRVINSSTGSLNRRLKVSRSASVIDMAVTLLKTFGDATRIERSVVQRANRRIDSSLLKKTNQGLIRKEHLEPSLLEMAVARQCIGQPFAFHHDKRNAIRERFVMGV